VDQRSEKLSFCGTRKAVSDRFISAATDCIQFSDAGSVSRQTAAGLPAKARSVKASTMVMGARMADLESK
jgi:hypothetical protein